ncbi:TMM98 protein, partial [Aegotheles bennettii]|nr:TMM98 protein [Aegotheles bennettii]
METVVIVAIGVLATIFLASFVALVVVCRQRYCHPKDLRHHYDTNDGSGGTNGTGGTGAHNGNGGTNGIDGTGGNGGIERPPWPPSHCPPPQICHTLTEKLVAMTMGSGARVKSPASLGDISVGGKRISPRVDDVVRSMYPPLDPKLLDAR